MLNISESKLTYDGEPIASADSTIRLVSDKPSSVIGVIRYADGREKSFPFAKSREGCLTGRLTLSGDELKGLPESSFYAILVDGVFSQRTNAVSLAFDLDSIRRTIRASASQEVTQLRLDIDRISKRIDALSSSGFLKGIQMGNAPVLPGMVPVAVDSKGNFMPAFPFADVVKSVNGKKAYDGEAEVLATDIKYKAGKSVGKQLDDLSEAAQAIAESLKSMSEEVKKISERAGEIEKRLEWHIANGII